MHSTGMFLKMKSGGILIDVNDRASAFAMPAPQCIFLKAAQSNEQRFTGPCDVHRSSLWRFAGSLT